MCFMECWKTHRMGRAALCRQQAMQSITEKQKEKGNTLDKNVWSRESLDRVKRKLSTQKSDLAQDFKA